MLQDSIERGIRRFGVGMIALVVGIAAIATALGMTYSVFYLGTLAVQHAGGICP